MTRNWSELLLSPPKTEIDVWINDVTAVPDATDNATSTTTPRKTLHRARVSDANSTPIVMTMTMTMMVDHRDHRPNRTPGTSHTGTTFPVPQETIKTESSCTPSSIHEKTTPATKCTSRTATLT